MPRRVWSISYVAAPRLFAASLLFVVALLFSSQLALAQFLQQGPKLVTGTGAVGNSEQGFSLALSRDGNTAIVGGPYDNNEVGAAWVYTRSGKVWTQQGTKLFGNGTAGSPLQGSSVALSEDGNTALLGGPGYNADGTVAYAGTGAVWVYVRDALGNWTQQGGNLIGTGANGKAAQGSSVALSSDGNTAIVGGPYDTLDPSGGFGAAWVYTRSGGVWTQLGSKLVGNGASGTTPLQGSSVALSGDGNTAIVGGPSDDCCSTADDGIGAAWIYKRSDPGVFTQQGNKLVASDALTIMVWQGYSVALSGDGNTAIVGGPYDNDSYGAAWVFVRDDLGNWTQQGDKLHEYDGGGQDFQGLSVALSGDGNTAIVGGYGAARVYTRSGGVWTQLGSKLVVNGAVGARSQSVAMSSDGNTVVIGSPYDNNHVGAAWIFARPKNTLDYNGDHYSDIAWRDNISGDMAVWLMNGAQVLASGELGAVPNAWSIVGQRDFDGDGKTDLLWHDNGGNTAMWFMNGLQVSSTPSLGNIDPSWRVVATGDFDGDGKGDIVWRDPVGNLGIWLMNGATASSSVGLGNVPTSWVIVGTGDFNGDGKTDLLWRDNLGNTAIWFMNGTTVSSSGGLGNVSTYWYVIGTGDFNGDGFSDILWRDGNSDIAVWLMNGLAVSSAAGLGEVPGAWIVVATGDYNGDGMSDLLWRDTTGNTGLWFMNGTTIASTGNVGSVPTNWTVQSVNAE